MLSIYIMPYSLHHIFIISTITQEKRQSEKIHIQTYIHRVYIILFKITFYNLYQISKLFLENELL